MLRMFLSQNCVLENQDDTSCFYANETDYIKLCDDFGPSNFASVAAFIQNLDQEILNCYSSRLVYNARKGRRALTNAIFLLGAFMILRLKKSPLEVSKRFEVIGKRNIEDYRDSTFLPQNFGLRVLDCWSGLNRAIVRSWLACPTGKCPQLWGKLDLAEYVHYGNPLNGDLHEVVPGKFVAFKGPKNLVGRQYADNMVRGHRDFSPTYYIDIFRELGVSTVLRLNEAHYDACAFTDVDINVHDLYFEDCTAPPKQVVRQFFRIVDAAPGLVALHCKAGLGRTGTLIAVYLIRSCGFTAREAMGWLRVMRPGSVIGEQQHYLCEVERHLREYRSKRASQRSEDAMSQQGRRALSPQATLAHLPGRGGATAVPPHGESASANTEPLRTSELAGQAAADFAWRSGEGDFSGLARGCQATDAGELEIRVDGQASQPPPHSRSGRAQNPAHKFGMQRMGSESCFPQEGGRQEQDRPPYPSTGTAAMADLSEQPTTFSAGMRRSSSHPAMDQMPNDSPDPVTVSSSKIVPGSDREQRLPKTATPPASSERRGRPMRTEGRSGRLREADEERQAAGGVSSLTKRNLQVAADAADAGAGGRLRPRIMPGRGRCGCIAAPTSGKTEGARVEGRRG